VRRLHKGIILILGLALIACLAVFWKARRDLQAARQELQEVRMANEFLKMTLGDMTVAMTAKDRAIDLERARCEEQKDKDAWLSVPAGSDVRSMN